MLSYKAVNQVNGKTLKGRGEQANLQKPIGTADLFISTAQM